MNSPTEEIEKSQVFRDLSAQQPGVEVWPDEDFDEGGFDYFWIVSRSEHTVRNLAYVRMKDGCMENRCYDDQGDDLWVSAQ